MGESKVKFGDLIFYYGHFLQLLEEFEAHDYNAVMGYMTVGGYMVTPVETDIPTASLPGLIAEFPVDEQFTVAAPFTNMEMVDVTDRLALDSPMPTGTKVWMPVSTLSFDHTQF